MTASPNVAQPGVAPIPDTTDVPKAPAEGEERVKWIADQLATVRNSGFEDRRAEVGRGRNHFRKFRGRT